MYKLIVSGATDKTFYFDSLESMKQFASTTFGYLSAWKGETPIGLGTHVEGYLYGEV